MEKKWWDAPTLGVAHSPPASHPTAKDGVQDPCRRERNPSKLDEESILFSFSTREGALCRHFGSRLLSGALRPDPFSGYDCVGLWEAATGCLLATFETGNLLAKPSFTPDNRDLLVFGSGRGQRWNLAAKFAPNSKATPGELWTTLKNGGAKEAVCAANGLVATAAGRELLMKNLPPAKLNVTKTEVTKWLAGLGDSEFATREAAEKALVVHARQWEGLLRESTRTTEIPEVKTRLTRFWLPWRRG